MDQILIDVFSQKLFHYRNNICLEEYDVSTAAKGVGEQNGSEQTPRGWHIIRAKIGKDALLNSVFVSRRWTGEIYTEESDKNFPNRDWILTRILWLSGCEIGKNRLYQCDTMRRYIYIHGSPDYRVTKMPNSKGCIRMRSQDIIKLFDNVSARTPVFIRG